MPPEGPSPAPFWTDALFGSLSEVTCEHCTNSSRSQVCGRPASLRSDVTLVLQQFDMQALLNKEIDAARGVAYNSYAQVPEATSPDAG